MKYIIANPKGARVYKADMKGTAIPTQGFRMPKEVIEGELTKARTPKVGGALMTREFIRWWNQGQAYFVLKSDVIKAMTTVAKGNSSASNFSGAEVANKIGGTQTIVSAVGFGAVGFVLANLIGGNKIGLTAGFAVLGGLIGYGSGKYSPDFHSASGDAGTRRGGYSSSNRA